MGQIESRIQILELCEFQNGSFQAMIIMFVNISAHNFLQRKNEATSTMYLPTWWSAKLEKDIWFYRCANFDFGSFRAL